MNMNKLKNFAKQYGFYVAVGIISLGTVTAVYLTSNKTEEMPVYSGDQDTVQGEVTEDNLEDVISGEVVTDAELDALESVLGELPKQSLGETPEPSLEQASEEASEELSEQVIEETSDQFSDELSEEATTDIMPDGTEESNEDEILVDEQESAEGEVKEPIHTTQEMLESEEESVTSEAIVSENMTSETISPTVTEDVDTPFFAEGDTMSYPVQGQIIVPYTDDTTRHWLSTALNQTMRTYGICIAAKEGDAIKSPADATVTNIIDDATSIEWYKRVGDVGKIIILDHGNGYQTQIGVQGGAVDKTLLGQKVTAGTTIATVGQATGPFVGLQSNVYLQVKKDDTIIDPTTLLVQSQEVAQSADEEASEE